MSLIINHLATQADIQDSLYDRFIASRYNWGEEHYPLRSDSIEGFIEKLKEHFKDFKKYIFESSVNVEIYLEFDGAMVVIVKSRVKTHCHIYAKDLETFEAVYKIYKDFEEVEDEEVVVDYSEVIATPGGITTSSYILKLEDLDYINDKYYPYIDMKIFADEFIFGDENILILCGVPGTGKSKFASTLLKYLMTNKQYLGYFRKTDKKTSSSKYISLEELLNEADSLFAPRYNVATCKNIDIVVKDEFWNIVSNMDLLVLDDLDYLLSSRNEDRQDVQKNQFLSYLLSFSDGVTKNKTKIIITTNQPFESIDEALLRRGRLFAILEFRELTEEEALSIWESEGLDDNLFGEATEEYFTDGYIKHSDLGHAIDTVRRNNRIIKKRSFLKDPSIDALNKAEPRRAGII